MKKEVLALGLCMALGLSMRALAAEEAPVPMLELRNPAEEEELGKEEEQEMAGEVLLASADSLTLALGRLDEEGFSLIGEEVTIPLSEDTRIGRGAFPFLDAPEEPWTSEEILIEPGDLVLVRLDEEGRGIEVTVFEEGAPEGALAQEGPLEEMVQVPSRTLGEMEEAPDYEAVLSFASDEEIKEQDIISHAADENAVHISRGAFVSLTDVNLERESERDTGGEASRRYGVGAAALVTDGDLSILGGSIRTKALGAAGVFAYSQGAANLAEGDVHTERDKSPGVCAVGGGTLSATNLMVITEGENSAALYAAENSALTIEGGSFLTKGSSSPALYGGGTVSVGNAVLEAEEAEAIRLEETGKVELKDCTLVGNLLGKEKTEDTRAVLLTQRIPLDEQTEGVSLSLHGGSLSTGQGGFFYVTNTACDLELEGVTLTPAEKNPFFLRCTGNAEGIGIAGKNGAYLTLTAKEQECVGDVIWDSFSSASIYLEENSTLVGAIYPEETHAGSEENGGAFLSIEEGSTWVVTGDSTLTCLSGPGEVVDEEGNRVSIVGSDGTEYVQGDAGVVVVTEMYEPGEKSSDSGDERQ